MPAWPKLSTVQIALLASVAVHAALLTVRFVAPESFNRVFKDTPLEVVLVNSKSNEAPVKAQALAQANLNGGGMADAGRATSPLPPSATMEVGEATELQRAQIDKLQEQQRCCQHLTPCATRAARKRATRTSAAASWCSCWPRSKSA
jgi:protein TonB